MKKTVKIICIMIIVLLSINTISSAAFTLDMEDFPSIIEVGQEQILKIKLNEKIIAANFMINYDNTIFELKDSDTDNFYVAEKEGKIACVYADSSGEGTKELKIKLKAIKETGAPIKFSIEDAKFRADGKQTSYTGTDIQTINDNIEVIAKKTSQNNSTSASNSSTSKITSKGDTTIVNKTSLPNAGKVTCIIAIIILVVVAIIFGFKNKELKKIFSQISIFIIGIVLIITSERVYAVGENSKKYIIGKLKSEEEYVGILIDKNDSDKKITKKELMDDNNNIEDVLENKNSIKDTDFIKTGNTIKISGKDYTGIVYGDANYDGILCNNEDIMVIVSDYLGEISSMLELYNAMDKLFDNGGSGEKQYSDIMEKSKIAANLYAKDDILDADDIMQMIDYSLSKLNTDLLSINKENNSENDNQNNDDNNGGNNNENNNENNTVHDDEYLNENWDYTKQDNTLILNVYKGTNKDVTIKANYNLENKNYTTKLGTTQIVGYAHDGSGAIYSGPFAKNTTIETVTFENTSILNADSSKLFYDCSNLKRVIGFGGNISNMESCFSQCVNLHNEMNTKSTEYISNSEIVIPDTVTKLDYAFFGCTTLEYLPTISENSALETAIYAFSGCSGAHSGTINLTSTLVNITRMFYNCSNLGHYSGDGFIINAYINPYLVIEDDSFVGCGIAHYGSGAYGEKNHEIVVKNATSESDEVFINWQRVIDNSQDCSLSVRL